METRHPLPKTLRSARALLFVQGGLGIAGGLLIIALLAGEDDAGLVVALSAVSAVLAAVLLVAAAMMGSRPPWVRPAVLAVETIVVINGAINLLIALSLGGFQPMMLFPVLFGILVIQAFMRQDAKDWFAGRPV